MDFTDLPIEIFNCLPLEERLTFFARLKILNREHEKRFSSHYELLSNEWWNHKWCVRFNDFLLECLDKENGKMLAFILGNHNYSIQIICRFLGIDLPKHESHEPFEDLKRRLLRIYINKFFRNRRYNKAKHEKSQKETFYISSRAMKIRIS